MLVFGAKQIALPVAHYYIKDDSLTNPPSELTFKKMYGFVAKSYPNIYWRPG